MPMLKKPRFREPLWKEWDQIANKTGWRKTVYDLNKDEYQGHWVNNIRQGKGSLKIFSTGQIYEGDFHKGLPHGSGILLAPVPSQPGKYIILYKGTWKNGKPFGPGMKQYGDNTDCFYEGQFDNGKRTGHGVMQYSDGSKYTGEWLNDMMHGEGEFVAANGDTFTGIYKDDLRHGNGVLHFYSTGQMLEGVWYNGVCKTSTIVDMDYRDTAPNSTRFIIPECKLTQPGQVAAASANHWRNYI